MSEPVLEIECPGCKQDILRWGVRNGDPVCVQLTCARCSFRQTFVLMPRPWEQNPQAFQAIFPIRLP